MLKSTFLIKTILVFILFQLSISTSYAQNQAWQWVKEGGSSGSTTSNDATESCKNIYTDDFGNVYGISYVFYGSIAVDTVQKSSGFGYDDFCVFSYRCDGSFRWVRFFGGPGSDFVGGITVDQTGNVFVTGNVGISQYGDAHYGDSTILQTPTMGKSAFVAKLDSSGHTAWLNMPGPLINTTGNRFLGVEKDNQGNLCVLAWINSATVWNGFTISGYGHYILKFGKTTGTLLGITKLDLQYKLIGIGDLAFSMDVDNNIYMNVDVPDTVIVGNDTAIANSSIMEYNTLLMKFNPLGQKVWCTQVKGIYASTTNNYKKIFGKPLLYDKYVYMPGETQSYPGTSFFLVPINNPVAGTSNQYTKIIARFDKTTGNFVSVINLKNKGLHPEMALSVRNNKILAATSGWMVVTNQTDTIKPVPPANYVYPFIVEMDTALTHFNWGVATTAVLNGQNHIECMTVDKKGNIFLGGRTEGSIFNSFGISNPAGVGGENFFIAKIATTNTDCGCDYAKPKATLVSLVNKTLTVKGSCGNTVDSLYWYWGDGSSSPYPAQNVSISHTYQNASPYSPCLRAWNSCSIVDSCLQNLHTGINGYQTENNKVFIYPNPFTNTLTIEFSGNLENAEMLVFDIVGKQIINARITETTSSLNTSTLSKGVYLVKIVSGNRIEFVGKIVKN